jgi:Fe-S-cluster containining protein
MEDVERITKLGFKLDEFADVGEWDEEDYEGAEDWWMNSMVKVDDTFYKLEITEKEKERCFFLEHGKGCTLGDKRPLHCKTYPFWVENNQVVYDDPEERFCPINKRSIPVKHAVTLVGETEENIMNYYDRIKKDCIENSEKVKELVLKLLKNNK